MMIETLPARDGEQPGRKEPSSIELAEGLKRADKSLLRDFARIGLDPAEVCYKPVDSSFIPINHLLERRQRTSLSLPGQLLIRRRLEIASHWAVTDQASLKVSSQTG